MFIFLSFFFRRKCLGKEDQLSLLNAQIHPHFLYNSLNTIYNLTLKKSEQTSEAVLKLSELLDYILYKVDQPKVLLSDEIHHLENLILLEKIKFKESLKINFTKINVSDQFELAPLLFLPFLENAIKHGAIVNGVLLINLCVKVVGNTLYYSIENSISKKNKFTRRKGIGLRNIKKRLEILYVNNYKLKVKNENQKFKVYLKIENLNTYG